MTPVFPPRKELLDYLERVLLGPANGPGEVVEGTPLLRYMTGMLFPSGVEVGQAEAALTATAEDAGGEPTDDTEEGGAGSGSSLHPRPYRPRSGSASASAMTQSCAAR